MLIYSMSVSVDGFIADREGAFGWSAPSEELFRFHLEQVRELGGSLLGRRLYETMLVWETDPSLRDDELGAAFADVWCALPKVVFSSTLDSVRGNARLAEASLAEEVAAALEATDKDVEIGGAGLAAAAVELGLVDELRLFRNPVVVGGGTPFLPPVTEDVPLDLIETRTPQRRLPGPLRSLTLTRPRTRPTAPLSLLILLLPVPCLLAAAPPPAFPASRLGCPARFIWQVEEKPSSAKRWTALPRKPRRDAGSRAGGGAAAWSSPRRTTKKGPPCGDHSEETTKSGPGATAHFAGWTTPHALS
jgi:dihydrofolate reductase